MANKQNKKTKFSINFETNIEALQKANQALSKIIENGNLISRQGNTLKGAYKSSGDLLKKLTDLQENNGKVSVTELRKMEREYEKIMSMINSLKEAESVSYKQKTNQLAAAKQQQKEYQKAIEETEKKVKELQDKSTLSRSRIDKSNKEEFFLKYAVSKNNKLTTAQSNLLQTPLENITTLSKTKKTGKSDKEKQQIDDAKELIKLIEKEKARREEIYQNTVRLVEQEQERLRIAKQKEQEAGIEISNLEKDLKHSKTATDNLAKQETLLAEAKKRTSNQVEILTKNRQREADVNDKVTATTKKLLTTGFAYRIMMSGVRKVLNDSVRAVIDMDKALTDMSIVTGQSREELYAMIPALNKLGQAAGATATEIAGLTAEYMKQGRSIKDSMELAEQTAKAAKISGISVADSVAYMTSAINGFNLAATDAEHVSDVFAKVAAATATDYKDLAISLSKVSAQANTAGMSLEFTTTLLAKGIETTQEAPESIGTALKTVIARMRELSDYGSVLEDDTSINKVERALDAAGIALRDVNGEFRDLEEVFRELGPQWDSLNTMQQQAIAQAVAGTRQQSRFLAIMQDWDRTLEISSTTLDAAGASTYQFSQYSKGLEYSITNLKTSWQGFVQTFTNTDTIKGTLDIVSTTLNAFANFMNIGDGLVGNITTVVALIGAAVLGFRKWYFNLKLSTQEVVNNYMATQGVTEEVAEQQLKERKLLTITQKITLEREKQLRLKREENKQSKVSEKSLKNIFNLNQKDKKFTDGRTSGAKALAIYAQEQNLSKEQELKIANALNIAKQSSVVLENQETASKLLGKSLTQDEVEDELAIAASKGIGLTIEEAITAAKVRKGLLTEDEEKDLQKITNEELKQYLLEVAQNKEKKKGNKYTDIAISKEGKFTFKKLGTAILNIFSSVDPITAAIIATALVAAIGIAGFAVGSIATTTNKQKAVTENQETIYENKEKKNNIKSLKDEYAEILEKDVSGMATSEELDRLKDIEEELKEIDKNLVGTGQDLLNTLEKEILSIDEETSKLVKRNKQNVIDVATDRNIWDFLAQYGLWTVGGPIASAIFGDDIKEAVNKEQVTNNLKKEENQLAFRQAASYKLQENNQDMLKDPESMAILNQAVNNLDALYAKIDWDKFAEQNYNNLEESLNLMEDKFSKAAMDIANNDTLFGGIAAYEKNLQSITVAFGETNPQLVELYKNTYKQYDNLIPLKEQINSLEKSGAVTGDQITNLISRLRNLDVTSRAVSKTLEELINSEGDLSVASTKMVKDMIANQYDISLSGLQWWSEKTGVELSELQEKVKNNDFQSWVDNIIAEYSKLASNNITAANVKDYRTQLTTKYENVFEVRDAILEGNLSTKNKDYLAEHFGELYASADFQKAIAENGAIAAQLLTDALTGQVQKTIDGTNTALIIAQDKLKSALSQYGLSTYDDLSKMTQEQELQLQEEFGEKEWKTAKANIISLAIEAQTLQDSLTDMEDYGLDVEELDAYTESMSELEKQISMIQEKFEESNDLDFAQQLAGLFNMQYLNASEKFNQTLDKMAIGMQISVEELKKYYNIVNGQVIPITSKINSLSDSQRYVWLENAEALNEYSQSAQDATSSLEDLRQQIIDVAIEKQDYFLNIIISKHEKETESLQENLEQRRSLYEKYFDDLEGKDDTDNYEVERQKLLNRIANLSTATDSTSLAKLKEAQQELQELTNEYNTSQRDARRDAVMNRFNQQSEELDKHLEQTLKNGETLWQEMVDELKNPEGVKKMLEDSGLLDGMTVLQMQQYLEELFKKSESVDSYNALLGQNWSMENIDNAIATGLLSPTVTNGNINTQNNTTNNNITINGLDLSNTNYSESELKTLIDKSFEEMWNNILKQNGENQNLNPF